MRAVEDHHVDRPEVQAQQCVQLTGTNRPIGFIRSGRRQTRHRRKSKNPSVAGERQPTETTVSCAQGGAAPAAALVGFPGLVVLARVKHPIPSRTRPLSTAAPMVLRPKTRESRSPPNPISPRKQSSQHETTQPLEATPPRAETRLHRGVEQPGSSSGS